MVRGWVILWIYPVKVQTAYSSWCHWVVPWVDNAVLLNCERVIKTWKSDVINLEPTCALGHVHLAMFMYASGELLRVVCQWKSWTLREGSVGR